MATQGIAKFFVLPREKTEVELQHVQKINKIALWAVIGHIPLFMTVAWACNTGVLQALAVGGILLAGPFVASRTVSNPRTLSLIFGFTSMGLGAALVHFGQGPVQIEMHFHFFASLALLTVWGNPSVIWVATVTVALHHLGFWYFLPKSVFNYDAAFWVVAVHAAFVVFEAVAASYIARNFYDNVIGLDKIVKKKTAELDSKNQEMRTILDNTAQGFLVIARSGSMSQERSAIIDSWFGSQHGDESFWEYLSHQDEEFAKLSRLCAEDMDDMLFDLEYYLDQMPKRLVLSSGENRKTYEFSYQAVDEDANELLVIITDITELLVKEEQVRSQMELINVFNVVANDKSGFLDYLEEGQQMVSFICDESEGSSDHIKRVVHTLKGTSGVFKLTSIFEVCHKIEDNMVENLGQITDEDRRMLRQVWDDTQSRISNFIDSGSSSLEVSEEELKNALVRLEKEKVSGEFKDLINSWQYEPIRKPLDRMAEQARAVAKRLQVQDLEVEIKDNGLRLDKSLFGGFWSVFGHVIRNSLDHGIKQTADAGSKGKLTIETIDSKDGIQISVVDNGPGIDLEGLKKKYEGSVANLNQKEILDIICKPGLSTKDEVTDISGRGVGMSAVKEYCSENNIQMDLETKQGKGTRFSFTFPKDQQGNQAAA